MPNKFYDPQIFTGEAGSVGGNCMHRCLRKMSALGRRPSTGRCSIRVSRLVTLLLCGLLVSIGSIARSAEDALGSSTSAEARADAQEAIPLAKMAPKYRKAVQAVLKDTSVFRRLPTQVIDCDSEMFTFMSLNPEVLVEIWRELGITQVTLERIDDKTFRMADGAGTTGTLVLVEQTCEGNAQNRIVMYAEGAYEGKPFTKPVKAQCVLLLRSGSLVENDGRNYVAARLDSFIHIDRQSLEIFAKVVHPLVGRTADRNFTDTIKFVGGFSQAAEIQPERIERLATSLDKVTKSRQQKLVKISYACGENARQTAEIEHTATRPTNRTTK